jgi:transcriptional regulator with XRE-family HTH domain
MPDRSDRWPQVGPWIKARYTSLGMRQADVARAAGVSDTWLRAIERGTPQGPPSDTLLIRLDQALEWPPRTILRLLDGDLDDPPREGAATADQRIERLEAKVDHLTELLMAALSGDTSNPFVEGAPLKRQHGGTPESFDPDEEPG